MLVQSCQLNYSGLKSVTSIVIFEVSKFFENKLLLSWPWPRVREHICSSNCGALNKPACVRAEFSLTLRPLCATNNEVTVIML